jgi:Xaa-Pro aminopeptidase
LARQAALLGRLGAVGLDGLLVLSLANIRYLTGFTGSSALLLIRESGATLITDFRYATQAPREAGNTARVEIDRISTWDRLGKVLGEARDGGRFGFEAHIATVRDAERIAASEKAHWEPVSDLVEQLRLVKDADEVKAIRAAADVAQAALAEVLPEISVGQQERAVAALLESALRRRGSEWHPFPTIVASGPRAALPRPPASGPSRRESSSCLTSAPRWTDTVPT